MKNRLYISGILLFGIIGIGISITIRLDYTWQKEKLFDKDIIYDTDIYGDLYQLNFIDNFRIPLPPRIEQYQFSEKHPTIDEAELFIFGDSFLDHPRQKGIPELLLDSIGLKVFYESHYLSPLYMVSLINVKKNKRRIIIMEVVERYLSTIDITPPIIENENSTIVQSSNESSFLEMTGELFNQAVNFTFPANPDKNIELILKRGKYINRVSSLINTFRFNLLDYISDLTPVYSKNPPFLFYHETVDGSKQSYFHFHSDNEIEKIGNNLKFIQEYLSDNYNLEFVLLPVPNKITIYHDLVTNIPYDEFLPRLFSMLEQQEIPYINVYDDFNNSTEMVYYSTDTHWNTKGMNIGYSETIKKLVELHGLEKNHTENLKE